MKLFRLFALVAAIAITASLFGMFSYGLTG
jgi:hypothetical protein